MKKIYIIYILMLFLVGISVSAKTNIETEIESNGYYINEKGVIITLDNYNKVKNILSEEEIITMRQDFYNRLENVTEILFSNSKIIETLYFEIEGRTNLVSENEITYEEFEEKSSIPETEESCGTGCWKTEYKRIRLYYWVQISGEKSFVIDNEWLKDPVIRSYDIIAMRWTGNVSKGEIKGVQGFKQNGVAKSIEYTASLSNVYYNSNGVGISMNLVDDAYDFSNTLSFPVNCSGTVNLYGTYQHAVEDISLSDSLKYTFGPSGMGGVLVFGNTSIANKYDNTQGLHISFAC